jgi:hypothetical protein
MIKIWSSIAVELIKSSRKHPPTNNEFVLESKNRKQHHLDAVLLGAEEGT